jgi:hypothetical protein
MPKIDVEDVQYTNEGKTKSVTTSKKEKDDMVFVPIFSGNSFPPIDESEIEQIKEILKTGTFTLKTTTTSVNAKGNIEIQETKQGNASLKEHLFKNKDEKIEQFCQELAEIKTQYEIEKKLELEAVAKEKAELELKFETEIRKTKSYKEASKMLEENYHFSVTQGINVLTLHEEKDKTQLKQDAEATIKTIYSKYGNEIGDAALKDSILNSIKKEEGKNSLYSESRMNLLTSNSQAEVRGVRAEVVGARLSGSETQNPEKPKNYTTQKLENILNERQR